jgi:hypothetical protein
MLLLPDGLTKQNHSGVGGVAESRKPKESRRNARAPLSPEGSRDRVLDEGEVRVPPGPEDALLCPLSGEESSEDDKAFGGTGIGAIG